MRTYIVREDYYLKDQQQWITEGMVLYPDDLEPDVFPVLVARGILEKVEDAVHEPDPKGEDE